MMWMVNQLVWALTTAFALYAVSGLLPHVLHPERRAAWWLAFGVALLLVKVVARSLYWDALPLILGPERALAVYRAMGGLNANVVFNLLAIAASYAVLRFLWLVIPEGERGAWSPWSAPLYPRRPSLAALIAAIRRGDR